MGNGIFTDAHTAIGPTLEVLANQPALDVVFRWYVEIGKVDCKAMRVVLFDDEFGSQAKEGMWGMPGHTEAMKAVVSCEKLGGVAHTR